MTKQVSSGAVDWPSPSMFAVDVGAEQLVQFHKACAKGAATVVCFGDSIVSQQADLISPTESPWFTLVQQLRAHNPGVAITEFNYAIAACSFLHMASEVPLSPRPYWWYDDPEATWFSYIEAARPDLVFVYSGGNDGYGFNLVAFTSLVAKLNALPKPPSLLFGITYLPSATTPVNDYNQKETQDGIHFVTGWVRGFCKRNGYAFLDFMRWHNRCRDGYDSTETTCTLVNPTPDTPITQYPSAWLPADEEGRWAFPANANENGVAAHLVTDFYVNFTLSEAPSDVLRISLSDSRSNLARPAASEVCLRDAGGVFEHWWSDGLNHYVDHAVTSVRVPVGELTLSVALKNELLTISVVPPSEAARLTIPGGEYGKITICELNVVRFGAPFRPVISGIGMGRSIRINNLCVANRTLVTNNFSRFQPVIAGEEIYEILPNAGGSGAYHMNAYGVQKIMNPVIRAASFRPPARPAAPVVAGSRSGDRGEILAEVLKVLAAAGLLRDETSP